MQCVSASMPVAAVREGGRPKVRAGSHSARVGNRCGLMKSSLRPSRLIIAARPTSLPVPAVVGIATVRMRSNHTAWSGSHAGPITLSGIPVARTP
jgi:hypothetical protein